LEDREKEIQNVSVRNMAVEGQIALYQKKIEDSVSKDLGEELTMRCNTLEQELLVTLKWNEELTKQIEALRDTVQDLQALAKKQSTELETALAWIRRLRREKLQVTTALLERCTDLETEKSR
jgi:predicted  nucleic acid-binding Zn-ribbon protein